MHLDPLNVLSIEDSESDFLLIRRALDTAGLLGRCQRIDTPSALKAALAEGVWDVVLSDYAVPGMYFTDTLRRFLHHYPELPLILVSGTIGEVKASVMVEVGAWDFVPKDQLSRRLATAVRMAMRRAALRGGSRSATSPAAVSPAVEPHPR